MPRQPPSPDLDKTFVASVIQWLQYGVFRMKDREEGRAGILLAQVVLGNPTLAKIYRAFRTSYADWLGWEEGYGIQEWGRFFREILGEEWVSMDPGKVWEAAAESKREKPCRVSLDPTNPSRARKEEVLAFFSPGETPVFRFFLRDMQATWRARGGLPSALDLLASGPLASPVGREIFLETFGGKSWAGKVLALKGPGERKGFFGKELGALALLQGSPHPGAEAPFGSKEWKMKMAWTQLGGIAGMEHTFSLYRRICGIPVGDILPPPSFLVSPYPEFFHSLAGMAREAAEILARNRREMSLDFQEAKEIPEKDRIWLGKNSGAHRRKGILGPLKRCPSLLDRLGAISRTQWSGGEIGKEDSRFLLHLGKEMEGILREASSLEDFPGTFCPPIVTTLAFCYDPNSGGLLGKLYGGIARPEALYLIVERKEGPLLYLGGVLSFREFVLGRKGKEPMDDSRWKEWVDQGKAPDPPKFTKRFRFAAK